MARRNSNIAVYARGEETRARILDVAIRLFGAIGFDGVTTRMIATEAGVPAPSLRYYFENKEGLYSACWKNIQAKLFEAMEPALVLAEHLLEQEAVERMHLIDAFCAMQLAQFEHMMSRPDSSAMAQFVARHDLAGSNGQKRLPMGDGATALRMVTCFTRLIMRISGGALDWPEALIVAGLANSSLAAIASKRKGLAEVGVVLEGERLAWLRRAIRQQTIAALMVHCG